MIRITFVEADGSQTVVDAKPGMSLMENGRNNGVPGILADCGGNCACATCRVYVPDQWQALLGARSDLEEATLEIRDDDEPGRRLSCQITVTEAMDGLTVRLPDKQF